MSNKEKDLYHIFGDSISSDNPFTSELFKKDIQNKQCDNIDNTHPQIPPYPSPSDLRISTMTAICSINIPVNLNNLKELVVSQNEGLLPYSNMKLSVKKKKKKLPKTNRKNSFQNQCTFLVELPNHKVVNQKVFKNGNIQMTGLKSETDGLHAIDILIKNITDHNNTFEDLIVSNPSHIKKSDCDIVLINSDYSCGFKIKRDILYNKLGNYGLYVSYEPDIYPGVNAKFYWNTIYNNTNKPGICNCSISCDGKGTGTGNGQCKKVTISTFQSGNVIITGARNQQQTNDAYAFINKIFKESYYSLCRSSKEDIEHSSNKKNIDTFYINMSNIQNIDTYNILLSKLNKQKKNKKIETMYKPMTPTHKSDQSISKSKPYNNLDIHSIL